MEHTGPTKLNGNNMSKRNYTDKQQAFLKALPKVGFNVAEACRQAGYSTTNSFKVAKGLRAEILEMSEAILATSAPQAASKLIEVMNSNKPIPQVQHKLAASNSILDRVGVAKRAAVDVNLNEGSSVFILPTKDVINEKG